MPEEQIYTTIIIENAMRRPAMYTMNGTFAEVVSWLDGYCYGFYSGGAQSQDLLSAVSEWTEFKPWLANQLAIGSKEPFKHLEQLYLEDSHRLKALADFYANFLSER